MCERLPLVNPKKITASVMITRGQFDGIAHLDDLLEFFKLLPNPDKQFVMMPGIAHASLQEKNHGISSIISSSGSSASLRPYSRAEASECVSQDERPSDTTSSNATPK